MKKFILSILRSIKYRFHTRKLMKPYFNFIEKNLGSNGISLSQEKMRANIMMSAHIIEKGLSLADVKPWFGQPKIIALIADVKYYYNKYGDNKRLTCKVPCLSYPKIL